MARNPLISVCIPMFNASPFIRECIDSILRQSFTDFELLIVDDGSTDDGRDIVRSYRDNRIRLIENKHDYIGSLNILLREAKGKYIARMDADDIMFPTRLDDQYAFMESHSDIDVMGGSMISFDSGLNCQTIQIKEGYVTLYDMVDCCCICHPTVIIRRKSLFDSISFCYERDMIYAEDYALWVAMLSHKKKIFNSGSVYVKYRLHKNQVSVSRNKIQSEKTKIIRMRAMKALSDSIDCVLKEEVDIPNSEKELTVIIPFLNEKTEVLNTVNSIRETVGYRVSIIAINDNSDDDYNYKSDLKESDVVYVNNKCRIGAAMSKERGVLLAKTKYILLLDAHMRFYSNDWDQQIVRELNENPNRILCCQSLPLEKNEKGVVTVQNDSPNTRGAYLYIDEKKYAPAIEWNNSQRTNVGGEVNSIACVLGAGYATSKTYWNKIHGLQGLIHYGCEEAFLSIKAWKEGGGCYLIPSLSIGHIYRKSFPYKVNSSQIYYNNLLVSEILFPTSEKMLARSIAWNINKDIYKTIMMQLAVNKEKLDFLRSEFQQLRGNDYGFIKRLNLSYRNDAKMQQQISDEQLGSIINYLIEKSIEREDCSLFNGITGVIILFVIYIEKHCFDNRVSDILVNLWNKMENYILATNDTSIENGLAGIGWALMYLKAKNLLDDDIEYLLEHIDKKMKTISIKRMENSTFTKGLGGIYCYVVNRLAYCRRNKKSEHVFPDDFMRELKEGHTCILRTTDDWRTFNFVSQFGEYGRNDWEILEPDFVDIITMPIFVPSSERYWDDSLNGVVGAAINKLINKYDI